jgi:hypothetical protein
MTPAQPKRSREEVARLGDEIFARVVKPRLTPADDGKYVAIDIDTEEYELDDIDWNAITRLGDRRRGSQIFVMRIGKPYRLSWRVRFPQ